MSLTFCPTEGVANVMLLGFNLGEGSMGSRCKNMASHPNASEQCHKPRHLRDEQRA